MVKHRQEKERSGPKPVSSYALKLQRRAAEAKRGAQPQDTLVEEAPEVPTLESVQAVEEAPLPEPAPLAADARTFRDVTYEDFVGHCIEQMVEVNPLKVYGACTNSFHEAFVRMIRKPAIEKAFADKETFTALFPGLVLQELEHVAKKESFETAAGHDAYGFLLNTEKTGLRATTEEKMVRFAEHCLRSEVTFVAPPPSPVRVTPVASAVEQTPAFQFLTACGKEVQKTNPLRLMADDERRFSGVFVGTIQMRNIRTLASLPRTTASEFASKVCEQLRVQATLFETNPSVQKSLYGFMLDKQADGSYLLNPEVQTKLTAHLESYFAQHQAQLQQPARTAGK